MTTPADTIRDLQQKNRTLGARNEKLVELLRESRDQMTLLRQDLEQMTNPPSTYGIFLEPAKGKIDDPNGPIEQTGGASKPAQAAEAIVIGCPVYFNNVPSQTKALIDRTWGYRGSLTNKIAGAVVVGRKYGAEAAIQALHAFYLKHNMIVANRGVCALGFKYGDVVDDDEAHTAAVGLAKRIQALIEMLRQ